MSQIPETSFTSNDRTYRPPARPVVVICIDGCADEYLSVSIAQGRMPRVATMAASGYRGLVRGCLPSFTNVNNCAIVTGTPPTRTGMVGNYIIDPTTGQELMTNSSKFLRNETILAAAANAGRKVAMVTAKDKLREMLSKNLSGIAFSSEKADEATKGVNGIDDVVSLVGPKPNIYSADASLYVLRAGVRLIENGLADFLYLSLTDFMQHTYSPWEKESLDFYAQLDAEMGRLLDLGAVLGATADHGMNAKVDESGQPRVIYLETELKKRFGDGIRVICPITDPYVVHHGALGSSVTVYVNDQSTLPKIAEFVSRLPGITEVHSRAEAALRLELPAELIGDLYVLAGRDWVIGRTPEHHDLSQLRETLRSHGGRYEEMVPLLLSHPLTPAYMGRAQGDPRNFDTFDFVCNGMKL